jgi:hypothetical protein
LAEVLSFLVEANGDANGEVPIGVSEAVPKIDAGGLLVAASFEGAKSEFGFGFSSLLFGAPVRKLKAGLLAVS